MSVIKLEMSETPYAQIPNDLIRNPNISLAAFRLMAYLLSHNNGYNLTIEQIERQTGMGRHQVNEGRKNLEALGWLETRQDKENGRFLPKTWRLLNPTAADFSSTESSATVKSAQENTNLNNIEIKKTTIKNLVQDFEKFWVAYPNKRGKQAAEKAFIKALNLVTAETLIAGAERYANDPNLPEPKYVKHPATWLNAGCWGDPPLPVDPKRLKQNEQQRIEQELNEYLKGVENEQD